MNYYILLLVLVLEVFIFNKFVDLYMVSYNKLEVFIYRIIIVFTLFVLFGFAKDNDLLIELGILLTLSFIEKMRGITRLIIKRKVGRYYGR